MFRNKRLQLVSMIDGDSRNGRADHLRIDIKGRQQLKAIAGKLKILDDGPAQVTCAQDHYRMTAVYPQNFANSTFCLVL